MFMNNGTKYYSEWWASPSKKKKKKEGMKIKGGIGWLLEETRLSNPRHSVRERVGGAHINALSETIYTVENDSPHYVVITLLHSLQPPIDLNTPPKREEREKKINL